MTVPTYLFKEAALATPEANMDSRAERKTVIAGGQTIDDSTSNPLDFGTIDISGGAANSIVKMAGVYFTVNGGNTTVDSMVLWIPTGDWTFANVGTTLKLSSLVDPTIDAPTNGDDDYVVNAVIGSYSWPTDIDDQTEPASNIVAGDDTLAIDITTIDTTDDVAFWALYLAVNGSENTGTYEGTGEFQFSFKFDYS